MKRQAPQHKTEKLPIPFDVGVTFLPVDDRNMSFSKQGKGVLDMMRLRWNPGSVTKGDIKLRFLRTQTYGTHSDLLHAAGYGIGEQPLVDVAWGRDRYKLAARYTTRPERRAPLEIGIMLAANEQGQSVENLRSYQDVRQAVAVVCGYLIAGHEMRRDAPTARFDVNVVNNFLTPGGIDPSQVSADNLQQLADKLAPR